MAFQLPALPYAVDALEPFMDAKTVTVHHDGHHATYTNNLNALLENHPDLQAKSIEDILRNLNDVPEEIRTAVRNQGGGYGNHNFFWTIMGPNGGGEPSAELAAAIARDFGSFDAFKQQFTKAATTHFGSGWAWLVADGTGKLSVLSTANQDSPYSNGLTPLLTLDVWEHAYYLKYQSKRADFINAWWNLVNWNQVAEYHADSRK